MFKIGTADEVWIKPMTLELAKAMHRALSIDYPEYKFVIRDTAETVI